MSEVSGVAWGKCAAYGCPLAGSMGSDGKWYCFCHVGRPSSDNDRISRAIQDLDFIAQSTLDIRGGRGTRDWATIYRNIQQRLIRAGRDDLLFNPSKDIPGLTGWLMRLERELIEATNSKDGRKVGATVPTATVIGPTHSDSFNPYAGADA
ncbi:hypothetical protein P3T40_003422 [Paraburkholderia sp. EB58]|jgi:hypothetical protein|uniref:hypothetical protein n=1 Tax=Paraburkholderia sp. EB58 TaxID=3035125 RepID=UPI003D1BF0EC